MYVYNNKQTDEREREREMQCATSERDYDNSSRFFVLFVVVVVCQHCGCGCTWFSLILYIHPSIRQLIPNYSFASPLSPTNQTILFCPFFQIGEHQRHSPQQQQNNSIPLFYFYLFFFFFCDYSTFKLKNQTVEKSGRRGGRHN